MSLSEIPVSCQKSLSFHRKALCGMTLSTGCSELFVTSDPSSFPVALPLGEVEQLLPVCTCFAFYLDVQCQVQMEPGAVVTTFRPHHLCTRHHLVVPLCDYRYAVSWALAGTAALQKGAAVFEQGQISCPVTVACTAPQRKTGTSPTMEPVTLFLSLLKPVETRTQ